MATENDPEVSRRQFLAGCAGYAVAASAPAAATDPQAPPFSSSIPSLGREGVISPYGQGLIDDFDRKFAQQRSPPEKTLHVVKDLGLDPSGKTPISQQFGDEVSGLSNARVEFPKNGTFLLEEPLPITPSGPVDVIGNGATLKLAPGADIRAIEAPELASGSVIQGLDIDVTAKGTRGCMFVGTNGSVKVRNITMRGYMPPVPNEQSNVVAVLKPIARTSSAAVRVRNFKAIGGTAAGMHKDDGPPSAPQNRLDAPIGLWVGQSSPGTVQMVNCKLRGWSNGTYSGRTKGTVQILGGMYWNNDNCQVRISGGGVVDGATLLLDDRRWSMKKNPGPYSLGEHQGVYAARIDPGGSKGIQDSPAKFVNVNIRGLSMKTISGLLDWEGSAGPGIVYNSKITNHIDVPAILGEAPGSQGGYGAAPQTNIVVKHSLITGKTTTVARVIDRSQSRIQTTCVKVPGAGPDGIDGMQIGQAVSFGKKCKAGSGLKNPKKVGKPGDLPKLPVPDNPGRGTPVTTPDFSERNPGILDGIANWFEDTVQAFKNTLLGFMKMIILLVFGPLIALALGAMLFIGVFFVVLLFIAAGLKGLKE